MLALALLAAAAPTARRVSYYVAPLHGSVDNATRQSTPAELVRMDLVQRHLMLYPPNRNDGPS